MQLSTVLADSSAPRHQQQQQRIRSADGLNCIPLALLPASSPAHAHTSNTANAAVSLSHSPNDRGVRSSGNKMSAPGRRGSAGSQQPA